MASEIDICSAALIQLGAQPISGFTDGTDKSRLCASMWPLVRNDVLRSHPWNCAIKRVTLAADTEAPAFGFSYQYALPSDWLRTLSCGDYGQEPDFKAEGRKILCNETPLKLRYVYRNEDPETYDAMLTQGLVLAMAARMAYAVTQSAALAQGCAAEYMQHMKRTRAVDGQDETPDSFGDYPLLASRFGSRT